MGLATELYNAVDYLLAKDTSEVAATLRQGLGALHHDDETPEDFPAAVHGQAPDTAQGRAEAAAANLAKAQADFDAAQAAVSNPGNTGEAASTTAAPPAV